MHKATVEQWGREETPSNYIQSGHVPDLNPRGHTSVPLLATSGNGMMILALSRSSGGKIKDSINGKIIASLGTNFINWTY